MTTATKTRIPTGTWTPDTVHSRVGFAVKHMGVTTVRGEFRDYDGRLEVDGDGNLSVEISIKVASVDTGQEQRDDHLRSDDFFGVEEYPEMTFTSTDVQFVDDDELKIVGDLTIRDQTRTVELEAEYGGSDVGMQEEQRLGLEATGKLSRKDFGMKFNAALGSGNAVVADKVRLDLDIAAIKQS